MTKPSSHGSIKYAEVDEDYLKQRSLKRYAGVWSLWALGVGAVISGDFFGWNFGLAAGGFGGLLIATIIIAIMYIGMCYSIAEMSPALPHTGGAYSFGRTALGPWGGYITGLAENMEYVLTPAVIVVGIGGYLGAICNDLFGVEIAAPIWWLISYVLFIGLNMIGVELTFRFTVFITFLALGILVIFWIGAWPLFSWDYALNIAPQAGQSVWLPLGWMGVANALPFAIWFYLAIEQLPLAAEEAHDPKRDIPKGMLYGILTLIIASFLTLFLNAGIAPGSQGVGASDEPLLLAFKTIFGDGVGASLLALIAVAGLIASFHTIIYAYGRNIYSLSRAGYFPKWLSITHAARQTPYIALIVGGVLGYAVALLINYSKDLFGDVPVGGVLLNMAVFGAMIAYIMQMISFIVLRQNYAHIDRPYVSPLGLWGAAIAGIIALVTLFFLFMNEAYVIGIYGCAVWFILGLLYFGLYARHAMILSPEEEFAVALGKQQVGR
jgi:ethanolamine permease